MSSAECTMRAGVGGEKLDAMEAPWSPDSPAIPLVSARRQFLDKWVMLSYLLIFTFLSQEVMTQNGDEYPSDFMMSGQIVLVFLPYILSHYSYIHTLLMMTWLKLLTYILVNNKVNCP